MAAVSQIINHDYKIDSHTGRIHIGLKSKTVDGNASWEGPPKWYSVDPQRLRDQFNGDLATFIAWAVREHRSIVGVAPGAREALEASKGKVVG